MSTRGLIVVKGDIEEKGFGAIEDGTAIAIYNHSDSYPSWLGDKIRNMLQELWITRNSEDRDYEEAKRELARRFLDWNKVRYAGEPEDGWKWVIKYETDEDLDNNLEIDYLFQEWIYVIDFDKERFAGYKSVWLEKSELVPTSEWDDSKGVAIKAFDVNFANMDELMGLHMSKIKDETEDRAWRYKNEELYGMNREGYSKIAKYITRIAHLSGLEIVKRDISHGGIEVTIENGKNNKKYYVELHFQKIDKEREFYKAYLMFGMSTSAFSGGLDYAIVDDYKNIKEVVKQIADNTAVKQFIERKEDTPFVRGTIEALASIL